MPASRWIPIVSVLCAVGALTSCSGDDGDSGAAAGAPSTSPTATSTVEARNSCTAEVELTGGVTQTWSGKAFAITENRSGPVQYFATKGKTTLQVLAADGDFDALATITSPKGSYTSQGGTVTADDKGAGAEVDADLTGDGKPVHATATFDC